MLKQKNLKAFAIFIIIALSGYFIYSHTGLILTIIGISFLVVIGILLLLNKFKKFLDED
jgi:hypothetical protein